MSGKQDVAPHRKSVALPTAAALLAADMNAIPEHEEGEMAAAAAPSSARFLSRPPPPPPPPAGRQPGAWRDNLRTPDDDEGDSRNYLVTTSSASTASSNERAAGGGGGGDAEDGYESDWEREVSAEGSVFYVAPYSDDELRQQRERSVEESASEPSGAKKGKAGKKQGKLSRLVRRRESKRDRSVVTAKTASGVARSNGVKVAVRSPQSPTGGGGGGGESSDNDSSTYYGQLKTFESVFESEASPPAVAEMQEVTMRIKGRKHAVAEADGGASLLEQMMGVVPVRRDAAAAADLDDVVIVAGYLTDGPAIKISDKLQIGDVIRLVDGQQVNLAIVEQLLSTYSSSTKVKLTIQRPPARLFPEPLSSRDDSVSSGATETAPTLVKMLTGDGPTSLEIQSMLKRLPYIVLYLTRAGITESSPELADVLYQYPTAASGHHSIKLLKVRGIFVTLVQALPEITGALPATSTVSVDGEVVHVGYADEGEDALLLALPDVKCNADDVRRITRDAARVLRLKHGSLAAAFSTRNHAELDRMFSVMLLDELLRISDSVRAPPPFDIAAVLARNPPRFSERLPASHWLNLPDDIKFQVDDAMNQFESSDFQDFTDDFYDLPREFNIVGSCVFHKGYLIASHLSGEDAVDVRMWCDFNKLLGLTRQSPVHQVVAWSEIFLTRKRRRRRRKSGGARHCEEQDGRNFLLLVGLGHQLLGAVLQTGGCAARPSGRIRPDPFYVDQGGYSVESGVSQGASVTTPWW